MKFWIQSCVPGASQWAVATLRRPLSPTLSSSARAAARLLVNLFYGLTQPLQDVRTEQPRAHLCRLSRSLLSERLKLKVNFLARCRRTVFLAAEFGHLQRDVRRLGAVGLPTVFCAAVRGQAEYVAV